MENCDTGISPEGLLYMKVVGCKAKERSQRGRPRNTSECGGEDGLKVVFLKSYDTCSTGDEVDSCSQADCAGGWQKNPQEA
jgi:hypothetical protein